MNQILGNLGIVSSCYGWHTWSLWEQYEHKQSISAKNGSGEWQTGTQTERRQRRHCIVCNKEQDEWIRDG